MKPLEFTKRRDTRGAPVLTVADCWRNRALTGPLPEVDIKQDRNEIVVKADLPGISKKDVSVKVEGNVLSISGERKGESGGNAKRSFIERWFGTFRRQVVLPAEADAAKVTAKLHDGVLAVHLSTPAKTSDDSGVEVKVE